MVAKANYGNAGLYLCSEPVDSHFSMTMSHRARGCSFDELPTFLKGSRKGFGVSERSIYNESLVELNEIY